MGDSSRNTNKIKIVFKAIDVAFSMYSKIPMPRFEWASEDMKYHLCFFPWVGIVIGLIEYAWFRLSVFTGAGAIIKVMLALAIPLLITGGFHVDGYMDTMDAIHSYQPREKKLEILKDPHIGAFSVICLVIYFLLAAGFSSELIKNDNSSEQAIILACTGFAISRALSGLSLMYFKNAKNSGMLNTSTKTADKKIVKVVLWIELFIFAAFAAAINPVLASVMFFAFAASYFYYYKMSEKNFGGITGDLAGFYVCISELVNLIFLVISVAVIRVI